jgi:rod shape-determining protein MreC
MLHLNIIGEADESVRNWQSNRWLFFAVSMFLCAGLIVTSQAGLLAPVEGIAAVPLNILSGIFNRIALSITNGAEDLTELQTLRERNADLEEALAQFQAELVELREIASDYQRLAELLDYTTTVTNQEFLAADVINVDTSSFLRTITINRGTRDGLAVGMPVVTRQGLVGRIVKVSANAARVLLVTDPSSAVSARLQTTRVEGSVVGQLSGALRMTLIPLGQTIQEGDLVITSGLGANFPPDIVIGQVTSIRQFEFELYQEAEIRSLNNFDTLEIVLVITSFQPVDLSIFEQDEAQDAGG